MKRYVSIFILAILVFSSISPSFAQKAGPIDRSLSKASKTVRFATTEAFTDGSGVWVRWQMESEKGNIGFYVYRIQANGREIVNRNLVLSSADTNGGEYNTFDTAGDLGSVYVVESVLSNGTKLSSEQFSVSFINDISASSGVSSKELSAVRTRSKGTILSNALQLPKDLKTEVEANQSVPDFTTQQWVASQPGVKIGVRKEGIYRVTRAELQAAGFNTSRNPALWQLYTDGVEQAITVGPNADYIEFYGKGIDRIESDTRMYYLVMGGSNGKRIGSQVIRPINSTLIAKTYAQTFTKKQRTQYLDTIINGDAENYWGDTISSDFPLVVNFDLSGLDPSALTCRVTVRIQGYTAGSHTVTLNLNGNALSPATGANQNNFSATYDIPISFLVEGANALTLASTTATDYSLFDQISIDFSRKYLATGNALSFFTQNYRAAKLEGFSSQNVRVFDITYDGSPSAISNLNVVPGTNGFEAKLPPNRGRLLFAVEDSAIQQAASVLPNYPSTLSTTNHNANLVILSYKDWMTQAEAWANYRRAQGFSVEVVNVEDVFDEFNYGVLSADSVKAFLQYAKENWQTTPQYVLLIGDGSFDSRNYLGLGYLNFIPVKIVNAVFNETASDDALVDFNGDGLAEIAIGRIPARDGQTVTDVLNKVVAFEQPPMQDLNRGVIFAYDNPNGYDFEGMSQRLRNQLPSGTPATMIGRSDANAQSTLINQINTGKYLANYSGHGTSTAWVNASFFSSTNVPQLTNANNQTIFTMLTCLNGFFHSPYTESLSERLLKATNGGAVAVWASSGLTTANVQELMATRFYNRIGAGNITRMGDLIIDAKSVLPGGADERLLWVLMGDPMLKVR